MNRALKLRKHYFNGYYYILPEIGDRVPVIQDKSKLCYNMAFVMEMLRFRNPTPLSVFHKALVDCKLGPFNIPKNTQVVLHQAGILMNEQYWCEPNQFKPERFLDKHGQFLDTKHSAYIPFSCGRRICPGEQLAITDLFLSLVRFIQLTSSYRIEFYNEHVI
ncbi:unnamed protein product [Medioppia subpectinata]|uniref:Cytochrome P450 n=1 Tax=Medioppia subpectinata TaxID=1979941 RepID=A0A7R9PX04_9ACAR|nr:unnamed protein product [Medioppia subpectinata]CAG2103883.1 unnamed protein product [Medioppia subpectinata]